MATKKTGEPKPRVQKTIDEKIKESFDRIETLFGDKFRDSGKSDAEKAIGKIAATQVKAKGEGKPGKSEKEIGDKIFAFARNPKPTKEDYLGLITVLFRASLDAPSAPKVEKPKPAKKE